MMGYTLLSHPVVVEQPFFDAFDLTFGVNFYDLSTLFRDASAFRTSVNGMVERYRDQQIDARRVHAAC